jgi:hypothetical protein
MVRIRKPTPFYDRAAVADLFVKTFPNVLELPKSPIIAARFCPPCRFKYEFPTGVYERVCLVNNGRGRAGPYCVLVMEIVKDLF